MDPKPLYALASGIAAALGDGWALVNPWTEFEGRSPHIRKGADGPEFYLNDTWSGKGRIHVGANYPKDSEGREQRPYFSAYSENGTASPSITFADTKSPQAAAKDITRRFLPLFVPLWEKQAFMVKSNAEYAARKANFAHVVAQLLDGEVAKDLNNLAVVRLGYRESGIREVELNAETQTVQVSIGNVSLAQLKAIQGVLA